MRAPYDYNYLIFQECVACDMSIMSKIEKKFGKYACCISVHSYTFMREISLSQYESRTTIAEHSYYTKQLLWAQYKQWIAMNLSYIRDWNYLLKKHFIRPN